MSTPRQQVYISLSELGFNDDEIQDALNACNSQGLLYNIDWCLYYLKDLKSTKYNQYNNQYEEKQIETLDTLTYLSDLNDIIFGDIECNGFILNGHANEELENILAQINKIYDILFDFLYETQLKKQKNNHNKNMHMGFGGRLNKFVIKSIISPLLIAPEILCKFASILNLDSLFTHDYSREEFNILFRLISMHSNHTNPSFMSFLDYENMIVKLPQMQIPNGFINYLQHRFPNWCSTLCAKKTIKTSISSNTEITLNLNEFEVHKSNKTNDKNEQILAHLFKFYNGSDEYMSQELAVELLTSSKLSQHILEIIWNESKHNNNNEINEYECDGLNEYEFIIALQLISLAQQCLPYNKYYLLSYKKIKYICLPSILIDIAFIKYMKNMQNAKKNKYKYKIYSRPLSKLIPYIPTSHIDNFMIYFNKMDRKKRGYLSGHVIGRFFRKSQLNESILAKVWDLSDIDNDGKLCAREFCIAMHLINCVRQGAPLPNFLPHSLLSHHTNDSNIPFTDTNINIKHFASLIIGDYVDFRQENGKYYAMKIVNVSNTTLNLVDEQGVVHHCNYKQKADKYRYRIAKYKSITMRAVTRKNMLCYACGDVIDINIENEWKLGVICEFDFGQAQVQIINKNDMYWVHLDNVFEVAPPNTYTSYTSYTSHTHSHSNLVQRKKNKMKKNLKSKKNKKKSRKKKRKNSASDTGGFVMINYPESKSVQSYTQNNEDVNEYHRPVIQFGGTETDKEVQYVLKTLNKSNRKHSYHSLTQNQNHKPDLEQQQYSNTAPSTPIKLTVKRYKYRARKNKSKSKRDYI